MTPQDLARLIDPEGRARTAGGGKLAVRCPAHNDKTPSLTVWVDKNGKAAFNCHAGCDHRDIVAALPDDARAEVESTWKTPEIRVLIPRRRHTPTEPAKPASRNVEAEYPYTTETGQLAYLVRRFQGKKIRQFHKENGRLIAGRGDAPLVPYRLPDIIAANRAGDTIYIVEGEKDADTLASHGLTATCNVGGAGKWTDNLDGWFAGAKVAIIPDNDEPGHKHAQEVRNHLDGVAETVRIVTLPDLPDKGDVTDWLEEHDADELEELAHQAPEPEDDGLPFPVDLAALMNGEPPETTWIIQPIIPASRLVGLIASRGVGKSLLALDILTRRAAGLPVFDQPADQPIHIVYLDYEMGPEDLYDRLADFGWTPDNPHFETLVQHFHYYQLPDIPPLDTPEGGAAVEALADRHDATLIVIDTLSRVISTGGENEAIPYQALYRHTEIRLKRQGRALVRIDHLGKDTTRGSRGSSAKEDTLDVIWQMEPASGDNYVLTRTKGRLGDMPARLTVTRSDTGNTTRHDLEPIVVDRQIVEAAALLDIEGFDIHASQNAHAKALRALGVKIRNSAVRKVVEYRRRRDPVTLEGGQK